MMQERRAMTSVNYEQEGGEEIEEVMNGNSKNNNRSNEGVEMEIDSQEVEEGITSSFEREINIETSSITNFGKDKDTAEENNYSVQDQNTDKEKNNPSKKNS